MADCCEQLKKEISGLRAEIAKLDGKFLLKSQREPIKREAALLARGMIIPIIGSTVAMQISPLRGELAAVRSLAQAAGSRASSALAFARNAFSSAKAASAAAAGAAAKAASALAQVAALAAAIASAVGVIGTLNVLGNRIDRVESLALSLGRDISKVFGLLAPLQSRVANLNDVAAEARSNASKALIEISSEIRPKLSSLNDIVAEARSNASKALSELSSIRPRLSTFNDLIAQANSNASKALSELSGIRPRLSTFNDLIAQANSNASKALSELSSIRPRLSTFNDLIAQANSNASRALAELSGIRAQLGQLSNVDEVARTLARSAMDRANAAVASATGAAASASRANAIAEAAQRAITQTQGLVSSINIRLNQAFTQITNITNITAEDTFARKIANQALSRANQALSEIMGLDRSIAAIPAAVGAIMTPQLAGLSQRLGTVATQTAPNALSSAAAAGVCSTTKPGGCLGNQFQNTNNRIDGLQGFLNQVGITGLAAQMQAGFAATQAKISTAQAVILGQVAAASTAIADVMTKLTGLATWLGIDRALNVLNLWVNVHNAYFLSSNLAQTLFSTADNVLQVFGVQLKDDEGNTIGVGGTIAKALDGYMQGVFGITAWEGIKTQWKAYSRIYQAASNILFSLRSISDSILSALEVTGSWIASIGNALRRAGEVGERAFGWMNPRPNFQNRFFLSIERTEDFVSSIDQIAGEVLNGQQEVTEIVEGHKKMKDAIAELNNEPQGPDPIEATGVKAAEDTAKADSQSPDVSSSDLLFPG